jgi:hypothetical protein
MGNIYTGSLYAGLASVIAQHGSALASQRALMLSCELCDVRVYVRTWCALGHER